MDARQQEALVRRLVSNPHDQAAIAEAHAAGQHDPEGYARLLEQVGMSTPDRAIACHWLNEAANVWVTTFQDENRAAAALLSAVDKDPTSEATATRLVELYRARDDVRNVAVALERRAEALSRVARQEPDWLGRAAELYEELGKLLADAPLSDIVAAKEAYAKAVDLDPTSQYAIYCLRELHKAAGQFAEALPYFGMEAALVTDTERRLALFLDEAEVAKAAGRFDRAATALGQAIRLDPADASLRQQLGALILESYRTGRNPSEAERQQGAELFVSLAEAYPGEHGFLYALCALELNPRHDRAMQLSIYFGEQLGRLPEVAPLAAAYVQENPQGVLVQEARRVAGDALPPPRPKPAAGNDGKAAGEAHRPGLAARPASAERPQRPASVRPAPGVSIDDLLAHANSLANKSRKNEAIAVYRQVLDLDPVNPDALNYLLEQLPLKRKYAELKDVLLGAIDSEVALDDDRLGWLRDLAGVSESHLRDVDTAIYAWQRIIAIDAGDDEAADQVKRLLEKARRWDDLAEVLRAEAEATEDLEVRLSLERNIAKLHMTRRKDVVAAGEAWGRIASLSPGDETALSEAVKLLEKGERNDLAADVIAENIAALDDDLVKRELYFKLADIRVAEGQVLVAAEALAEGADDLGDAEMWARAEAHFAEAGAWEQATNAADEQANITKADATKAELLARAAEYCVRRGDSTEGVERLEQAVSLAPSNERYAKALEDLLVAADRVDELVQLFLSRAGKLHEQEPRVMLRKRAASIQHERMGDVDAARATHALVLQDREDTESLRWLAEEAEDRGDTEVAVDYLRRLGQATEDSTGKIEIALREAELCAVRLKDVERAVERYEHVLSELDDKNEAALEQLGDLEIARGNHERGAQILERYLEATNERETKLSVAFRLAELYEVNLSQPQEAIRLLSFIHQQAPDDLEATARLCELAESEEQWALVTELMVELIAVEGDRVKVSEMTRRLAQILHTRLDNGEEALNVLGGVADLGDEACRQAYVELGDELGRKATVARRIVHWYRAAPASVERDDALVAAFDRFVEAGQSEEAVVVAKDLLSSGLSQPDIGETLERLAVELRDREALSLAHELRVRELLGYELAEERVRQGEVIAGVGGSEDEAVAHAEMVLGEVLLAEVEPLLARTAALCAAPAAKVDVYERHIARLDSIEDRLTALCRASDVAASLGDLERTRSLFDVALSGGLEESALLHFVESVRAADHHNDNTVLRGVLVEALSSGGQAARDGGRTRARLLRLAATIAQHELSDVERAFGWLGDGLILHVEDAALDTVEELAGEAGDYRLAEAVLTRALDEVFDGPLVRRLLDRRGRLREERLDDLAGAAEDLKRLHDLSPSDATVNERLVGIYEILGEHRGIVALLEDQILRNRDKAYRAELSRRVAKLWQDELGEPREAADAWRRVLRLSDGDAEAKEGLARAKEAMLAARVKEVEHEEAGDDATSAPAAAAPTAAVGAAQEPASPDEHGAEIDNEAEATDPTYRADSDELSEPRAIDDATQAGDVGADDATQTGDVGASAEEPEGSGAQRTASEATGEGADTPELEAGGRDELAREGALGVSSASVVDEEVEQTADDAVFGEYPWHSSASAEPADAPLGRSASPDEPTLPGQDASELTGSAAQPSTSTSDEFEVATEVLSAAAMLQRTQDRADAPTAAQPSSSDSVAMELHAAAPVPAEGELGLEREDTGEIPESSAQPGMTPEDSGPSWPDLTDAAQVPPLAGAVPPPEDELDDLAVELDEVEEIDEELVEDGEMTLDAPPVGAAPPPPKPPRRSALPAPPRAAASPPRPPRRETPTNATPGVVERED